MKRRPPASRRRTSAALLLVLGLLPFVSAHMVSSVALSATAGSTNRVELAPLGTGGWSLLGTAAPVTGGVRLTAATDRDAVGATFWPTPVPVGAGLRLTFDVRLSSPSPVGADGMALVLGDVAAGASAASTGSPASGLGFAGIPGLAVAFDTYRNDGEATDGIVGLTRGANPSDKLLSLDEWSVWEDGTEKRGGGDNPYFIDRVADWTLDRYFIVVYFNSSGGGVGLKLGEAPLSLASYTERFALRG